jgi:hypothetical protein
MPVGGSGEHEGFELFVSQRQVRTRRADDSGVGIERLRHRRPADDPSLRQGRSERNVAAQARWIRGAGVLRAVEGQEDARAVDGIAGLEITIARGRSVVPLPEGDRYLGFLFARGASADAVESSLRVAHACLRVRIEPHPPGPVGSR